MLAHEPVELCAAERFVINRLQDGIPASVRPFAALAEQAGVSEQQIVEWVREWLDDGVLTRFGPMICLDRAGGVVELCALAVPQDEFDRVAGLVNALPAVAHNYARDHKLNMWFVIGCADEAELDRVVGEIEAATGLEVYRFPKEQEYFVDLRFYV